MDRTSFLYLLLVTIVWTSSADDNQSKRSDGVFTLPNTETDKETDKNGLYRIVWRCRDRHQHRFPLVFVLIYRSFVSVSASMSRSQCRAVWTHHNDHVVFLVDDRHTSSRSTYCPGFMSHSGLSLTLVYSSTNMSKSVWASGFWKPLVHKNFILKILINNFFKSQKRSFLVKISLKSRRLHFKAP